jgi:cell volume regulation protein A
MVALLLLGAALSQPGSVQLSFLPGEIIFIFLLSVACGSIAAAIWKAALLRIAEGNEHLIAIGVAAVLYAISGAMGASGVIAVFVFGFFLGNISHKSIDDVRKFQSEVSFFLRTFFFIYLGVLLFHSPKPLEIALIALALSVLFAFVRMISSGAAYFLDHTSRKGRLLETVSSRGLTSAVLAVVVSQELSAAGAAPPIDLPLLALFVIFFTNLISAFLVFRKKGK